MNINQIPENTNVEKVNTESVSNNYSANNANTAEKFSNLIQPKDSKQTNENLSEYQILNKTKKDLLDKLDELLRGNGLTHLNRDRNSLGLSLSIPGDTRFNDELKFDIDSFSNADIDFLKQCIANPNLVNINTQNLQVNYTSVDQFGQVSYKSVDFSKGLSDLIEYAYKVQRPVRLEFGGDSSVILKIDNQGKVSAEFMSANLAMEQILKNNIPNLRNKFDAEGLPYKELTYKDNSKNNNKKEHKGG